MKKFLYLLVLLPSILLAQDKKTISGKVLDASYDMPIIGAAVYASSAMIGNKTKIEGVIEGSMLGSTTDFDGNFSFKVSNDVKFILVSYMGFETEKIDIRGNSSNLVIKLK